MKILEYLRHQINKKGIIDAIKYLVCSAVHKFSLPIYKMILFSFYKVDQNKIIFTSFPDYSDNAKIFFEYLRQQRKEYSFSWIVSEELQCEPSHSKVIIGKSKYYSGFNFHAMKEIATSKYIFYTHTSPVYEIGKRKGQIVINLWHGCGYKDRTSKIPQNSKDQFDFVLVPGKVFIDTKAHFFACDKNQVIPIGYPRYDLFSAESSEAKSFVENLKMENTIFIVWMPTYRKTASGKYGVERMEGYYDLPILESDEQLVSLNEICKENKIMLCIKRHPFQLRYTCESLELSNISFISNDDLILRNVELYNILPLTDGLISDYSSVAIDYVLLDKPLAFTLNDFKDYDKAQGFVFEDPLKYMPGSHLYSFSDMVSYLTDVKNKYDRYKERRYSLFSEIHNPCENYCERICDFLDL